MRVRKKLRGNAEKPRLSVFKSLNHIGVQLIDDEKGVTLGSFSTLSKELKGKKVSKERLANTFLLIQFVLKLTPHFLLTL